jgi:hypothetical protein
MPPTAQTDTAHAAVTWLSTPPVSTVLAAKPPKIALPPATPPTDAGSTARSERASWRRPWP